MPEFIKKHKPDIIVISVILVIAIISLSFILIFREEGDSVVVSVDGVTVGKYPLNVNATYNLSGITATEENPITNVLVIENGVAYLVDANCPDKTCVTRGKIRYVGQSRTCLPNMLTVKIVGESDSGVDIEI